MENQKNNKGIIVLLVIIIVILSVLCILFATGTISFKSNNLDNDDNNENISDNTEKNDKSWIDYLNSKNIVVKTSVWNLEKEDCEFKVVDISSEDFKKIVDDLSNIKITKYYYGNPPTGTICSDRFTLEYDNNKIWLEADGYVWIDDNILSNKIDLDVDNITYADNYTEDGYVYKFDVDFANIFNSKINSSNQNVNDNNTNDDKIDIDLSISNVSVDKDSPNAKISVIGTINLSYDNNKYAGVALSGYCLGTDNEKYLIWGPGDGRVLFHNDSNNILTLTENIPQDVKYTDGTVKVWSEVDWENVKIKYCKIEKMTAILKEGSDYPETVLNIEKEFK